MIVTAGILLWRRVPELAVLLGHMGGPFWAGKDAGAWTIFKGLVEPGETLEQAAQREFTEETGWPVPPGELVPLPPLKLSGGKRLHAFALEGDADPAKLASNVCDLEWPPRSGRIVRIPELDRAAWFAPDAAAAALTAGQRALVAALLHPAVGPSEDWPRTVRMAPG